MEIDYWNRGIVFIPSKIILDFLFLLSHILYCYYNNIILQDWQHLRILRNHYEKLIQPVDNIATRIFFCLFFSLLSKV